MENPNQIPSKENVPKWLGGLPKNWGTKKIKFLFKIGRGRVISQEELLPEGKYPVFSSQTKSDGCLGYINTYDFDCEQITWTTDGANAGTVFLRNGRHNCTNVCGTLQPKNYKHDIRFLSYSLSHSTPFYKRPDTNGAKIMNGEMADIVVTLPPVSEQKLIADFLDERALEIDKTIAKKKSLIELLKEQKSILINQAVTKGLNPDAPMRDSRVEWVGKLPKHWDVRRAKYLFREIDCRSVGGTEELLSVSHTTGVTPRSEKNVNMFLAEDYSGSKLCEKDDLVYNIMWAWMGALGVSDRTGIVSPSYGVYRQRRAGRFNSWYLEHLMRSIEYVAEYNRRSTGLHSSRLRLYADMFFAMEIGFPSREEQDEIERETKENLSVVNDVFDATHKEISYLQEYKQTLIAHAVTGKIKV